eukprot:COSAG06_NODE_63951_length_261_cov_0.506173_2_plen_43_part_01
MRGRIGVVGFGGGAAAWIWLCFGEGGEGCASMISDVLDHALDV